MGLPVGGIDVPPNQFMNRAIREAVWNSSPNEIDILPEELFDTPPHPAAAPTHHIREAIRQLSHRIIR